MMERAIDRQSIDGSLFGSSGKYAAQTTGVPPALRYLAACDHSVWKTPGLSIRSYVWAPKKSR